MSIQQKIKFHVGGAGIAPAAELGATASLGVLAVPTDFLNFGQFQVHTRVGLVSSDDRPGDRYYQAVAFGSAGTLTQFWTDWIDVPDDTEQLTANLVGRSLRLTVRDAVALYGRSLVSITFHDRAGRPRPEASQVVNCWGTTPGHWDALLTLRDVWEVPSLAQSHPPPVRKGRQRYQGDRYGEFSRW